MTAKEFLSQVYHKQIEIKSMKLEIDSYRALSTSTSAPVLGEKVQSTRNIEPAFVGYLDKVVDLEHKLQNEYDNLAAIMLTVGKQIDKIPNTNYRIILRYRHILCYTWEQIAAEMKYSVRWVQQLYKKAIASFEEASKL